MFGIKKFLFRNQASDLPADVQAGLAAWRERAAPSLDGGHFQTRYLVVDVAASGEPDSGQLLGIAAAAVRQGTITPADTLYLDVADQDAGSGAVERRLLAFLGYAAKAPLVTYHAPYVGGFLMRAYEARLGVDFLPQWIDLAWLLPAMFGDRGSTVLPLDHWLEAFGLDTGSGRRDAMENALLLARLLQMLLVRAGHKNVDSAASLIAESRASSFLRRVS